MFEGHGMRSEGRKVVDKMRERSRLEARLFGARQ